MLAKRQHWVPRLLLRNFTSSPAQDDPPIHVYDLDSGRVFKTSIKNVAQETHFYNTREPGARRETLESWLQTNVEGPAAAVITRLLRSRSVLGMSEDEKVSLARFVATLAVRGQRERQEIEAEPRELLDLFDSHGETLTDELRQQLEAKSDSVAIHNDVIEDIADLAPMMARMSWRLACPPTGRNFCSSDNPVLRFNALDGEPYGNLGLLSPGIQLHLGLSPELTLALVDPTYGPSSDEVEVLSEGDLLALNAALAAEATRHLFGRSKNDFDVRPDMRDGRRRVVIGSYPPGSGHDGAS
jgi:hypothetical protein